MGDSLLTLEEVAEILGLRPKIVSEYARRGELAGRRVGRRWTFTQAAVDAFLEEMPKEWVLRRQPREMNGAAQGETPAKTQEDVDKLLSQIRDTIPPKAQKAVDKLLKQVREKATKKPREPKKPKPNGGRARSDDGRFTGPRFNVEKVPRLPTFPARWVLEDPRQRPYLVWWTSKDDVAYALKMEPSKKGDAMLVTLETGEIYRISILRRPLPRLSGTALFYLCPWCRKPCRYLYRQTLVGDKLVDYLGLRCQTCAGLRFRSQGRYWEKPILRLMKEHFGFRLSALRSPWDPRAVSDPRLVAEGSSPQGDPSAVVGYYQTSEDKRMARVKRAWEAWQKISPTRRAQIVAAYHAWISEGAASATARP